MRNPNPHERGAREFAGLLSSHKFPIKEIRRNVLTVQIDVFPPSNAWAHARCRTPLDVDLKLKTEKERTRLRLEQQAGLHDQR